MSSDTKLQACNLDTGNTVDAEYKLAQAERSCSQTTARARQAIEQKKMAREDFKTMVTYSLASIGDWIAFGRAIATLPEAPLNWYRRIYGVDIKKCPEMMFLDGAKLFGIRNPTQVVHLVTSWEYYENADKSVSMVVKDDNVLNENMMYATACICNLRVKIPKFAGVEYHKMTLHVENFFRTVTTEFKEEEKYFFADVPGLLILNKQKYAVLADTVLISIQITAGEELANFIGMMPIKYEYQNVIFDAAMNKYIDEVLVQANIIKDLAAKKLVWYQPNYFKEPKIYSYIL